LSALFILIAVGGFFLFSATKGFMKPTDISLITLIIAALGIGIASFFNPCVLPLLPSYLVFQTEAGAVGGGAPSQGRLLRNGAYSALGLLSFMVLFGIIIGLLGETFIKFIEPGSTALLWFRRVIGVLLIGLGVALVANKIFSGLGRVEHFGNEIIDKGKGSFGKFYLFGFGYTLAGIGCVAPLVGGLSLFALSGGGLSAAFIVFVIASTVMASLMILLSVIAGFAKDSLTKTLVSQIKPIRLVGGYFLIAMGAFVVVITLNERLLQLLP
jgi:cytochrome c-type biogenesis protein